MFELFDYIYIIEIIVKLNSIKLNNMHIQADKQYNPYITYIFLL